MASLKKEKKETPPKKISPAGMLDASIALLERGVNSKDDRLIRRFLRNNVLLRKNLTTTDLITSYQFYVPAGTPNRDAIVSGLSALPASSAEVALFVDVDSAMDVDVEDAADDVGGVRCEMAMTQVSRFAYSHAR